MNMEKARNLRIAHGRRRILQVNDVRNVVVWGCHAKFPDVDHAVIKGKPFSEIPGGDYMETCYESMSKS